MVSPAVIGGFAAIDASVFAQLFYAARSYDRQHEEDERHHHESTGPAHERARIADRPPARRSAR